MRIVGSAVAVTLLSVGLAGCGGGGATPRANPPVSAGPKPTASASRDALVTFSITLPATTDRSSIAKGGFKPRYVAPTTQGVVITIAYPGVKYPPIDATTKVCNTAGVCALSATASLPVAPEPYVFTASAYGLGGVNDILSQGTSAPTTLDLGNTNVTLTLGALVASASLTVTGTPTLGGTSGETLPVTFQAFDADGNLVTGSTPFAAPFQIAYQEVDPFGAFTLQPGPTGAATCSLLNQECGITSNADTLAVAFNPTATDFPADPAYLPYEFVLYDANASLFTTANSADVATTPCDAPAPICVYAPSYYQELLASGLGTNVFFPFSPTYVAVNGSTIWTDIGVASTAQAKPSFTLYPTGSSMPIVGSLAFVPATGTAFAPDYTGNASLPMQNLYSISTSGTIATSQYAADTNTSSGIESGASTVVGPDGNVWWIDPVTAVLRYANPATPTNVSTCLLQEPTASVFLTGAQIVATPPGVSPSRIWFSAVDNFGGSTAFTYLGYVNVSAGANSCGSGQAGHYTAFDRGEFGNAVPPNGLAVDGAGNAWYNDGNSNAATNIGEATISATSGAVTVGKSVPLPGGATPGTLGYASQAWGMVYDPSDGNMYFAADDGLIGRFNPAVGLSSVTAYALPTSLSFLDDLGSGPSYNDTECAVGGAVGPCGPQLAWDAGTSANGRLTFTVPSVDSVVPGPDYAVNVAVQLDLGGAGVTFSAQARAHPSARAKPRRSRHSARFGRGRPNVLR